MLELVVEDGGGRVSVSAGLDQKRGDRVSESLIQNYSKERCSPTQILIVAEISQRNMKKGPMDGRLKVKECIEGVAKETEKDKSKIHEKN